MRCIQLRRHGGLAMPRPLGAPLRAKRRLRKIRYMTPLGRRTTTTTKTRRSRKRRERRRGTRSGGVARPSVRAAMRRNSVRPLPFGASRSWLASGVLLRQVYRLRYFREESRRSSSVKLQQQHCRSQRSSNQRHLQSLRRRRRRRRRLLTRCSRNCRQA